MTVELMAKLDAGAIVEITAVPGPGYRFYSVGDRARLLQNGGPVADFSINDKHYKHGRWAVEKGSEFRVVEGMPMFCSASESCKITSCPRKGEHQYGECCSKTCRDKGEVVRCVPVVPEVAEPAPEMMHCPGTPTCGRHLGVHCDEHPRNPGCSIWCGRGDGFPCVPVAAKPKPRRVDELVALVESMAHAIRQADDAITVKNYANARSWLATAQVDLDNDRHNQKALQALARDVLAAAEGP